MEAELPEPGIHNMRPDDAFWGARLVSRFSDEAIRADVGHVRFDDPSRDRVPEPGADRAPDAVARVWLNGVNPIVDANLAATGR